MGKWKKNGRLTLDKQRMKRVSCLWWPRIARAHVFFSVWLIIIVVIIVSFGGILNMWCLPVAVDLMGRTLSYSICSFVDAILYIFHTHSNENLSHKSLENSIQLIEWDLIKHLKEWKWLEKEISHLNFYTFASLRLWRGKSIVSASSKRWATNKLTFRALRRRPESGKERYYFRTI